MQIISVGGRGGGGGTALLAAIAAAKSRSDEDETVEAEEEEEELEELLLLRLLLLLLLLALLLSPPPVASVFSATRSSILSNRSALLRPDVPFTTVWPSGVVSRRYSVMDWERARRRGGREGGRGEGVLLAMAGSMDAK